MAKEKLKMYQVVPDIGLPSTEDRDVSIFDFKQLHNLVLYFYSGAQCANCLERLRDFASQYDDFQELNTEILGISSDELKDSKLIKQEYGIPFPLLSDKEGTSMQKFTEVVDKVAIPSVFILDRYGALYGQWIISHEEGSLPDNRKILKTLEYIEMQCPECGIYPEEERA